MDRSQQILDSRYSWGRLGLTLLVALIANTGIWMIVALLPDIEADFDASRAAASMPYTLTMIGFAAGNLLVGRMVDRLGAAQSIQIAAVVIAAGYVLSAFAQSVALLSAMHLVLGLGTAVGFGPLIADISHWFYRQRGIAVALVASGNYLSGAFWPTAMSGVLETGGWRAVYLWMALVTLAMIPLAMTLRRRLPENAHQTAEAAATARAATTGLTPRMLALLLGLAGIGCCVAMSMPQVHIVAYCVGLGYGPAAGQKMLAIMLLGGVVSRIISGLVADRLGGVRTLLIGSVLQCIALFLYLPYDGLVPLYVVSAVFGLSQGGIVPSYALVVREYMPAREAGARVGFVIMMTILGMALGGWLSGWIFDVTGSYQAAFLNGIAWNALNIAIMLWLLARTRPRAAQLA
ncbi:MFS transporter [Aliishimia ponticola]|uniref:MFS transporter n=2 Tax=Aliishimia ponticola TaxID=2499833 RepID=A0A4S4N737_9RHOB|nr:MFS transporter [Aliishimia ponticola]